VKTIDRNKDNRHAPPKVIVCPCPECRGRAWSLEEIRHECGANGGNPDQVVNGLTLPKIAKLIDHPLRYLDATPAGAWHPSAPVAREESEGSRWIRNTDPEALEIGPINPMRLSAKLDSGEVRE
jgi:hypothetical protein